jgi:putative DNA primase/helicase
MSDAERIASALSGRRTTSGFICRCPVSGHGQGRGDRNPSLLVKDGERALLVTCLAGCDAREILHVLRDRGLLDRHKAAHPSVSARERTQETLHVPDPEALAIWHAGATSVGSTVENYLRSRGITLPVPSSIRCGLKLRLGKYKPPTMIAAVQCPDGKVVAVQSTLLTPSAEKASVSIPRITLGALGSGAVRLAAAGSVLGIAEGVETAFSAMQIFGVPCWACLGAARMQRVLLPECVSELHIFADNDDSGRAAAERTAHSNRYRRVVLHFPPNDLKDWNDVLGARSRSAA